MSASIELYRAVRRAVRAVVTANPVIDRWVGRPLVKLDVQLHRLGVLRGRKSRDTIDAHGVTLHLREADQALAEVLFLNGDYEPATREAILAHLPPDGGFVDLGAHIGYFTLLAARHMPRGTVYAFEPTPDTRATLEKNLAVNGLAGRVRVVPLAVSDKRETLRFVVHEDSSEANGVLAEGEDPRGSISIEATDVDSYLEALGWPPVHVVKMDVEGQEQKTLRGMRQTVARNPGIAVIFEYNQNQLDRTGQPAEELLDAVRALGLTRFEVLFRTRDPIALPEELPRLRTLARRANVNLLARRATDVEGRTLREES